MEEGEVEVEGREEVVSFSSSERDFSSTSVEADAEVVFGRAVVVFDVDSGRSVVALLATLAVSSSSSESELFPFFFFPSFSSISNPGFGQLVCSSFSSGDRVVNMSGSEKRAETVGRS